MQVFGRNHNVPYFCLKYVGFKTGHVVTRLALNRIARSSHDQCSISQVEVPINLTKIQIFDRFGDRQNKKNEITFFILFNF